MICNDLVQNLGCLCTKACRSNEAGQEQAGHLAPQHGVVKFGLEKVEASHQ